jgi:hypothetical protein
MIETEELLQIKSNLDIKDTLQIKNLCNFHDKIQPSINDPTLNFSDETILEITKNLNDRDASLYENIFFSNEDEELLQVDHKDTDNKENCLINNQSIITTVSTVSNDSYIINDEKRTENKSNILNTSLPKNIIIDINKSSDLIINQENLTSNKVLQIEENFCIKEINDNISETINLVNKKNNQELSSVIIGIENSLPTIEAIVNNTGDPVITDQTHLISNKELLESKIFRKSSDQTLVSIDVQTINKEIPLKNARINISTIVTEPSETMNKNISDKEPNIISKLQNMNWLKTRSSIEYVHKFIHLCIII